jgi:flagellar FliL protein
MAEEGVTPEQAEPKKASAKKPLLAGVVLALALGGGGFYAVWSGLLLGAPAADLPPAAEVEAAAAAPDLPVVSFVPLDPLVVTLGEGAGYLRFTGQLEVAPGQEAEVQAMMPRIVDALNGFLRAVTVEELRDPGALILLRAQMLRRVQIIVGDGRVDGLLITEFVLS